MTTAKFSKGDYVRYNGADPDTPVNNTLYKGYKGVVENLHYDDYTGLFHYCVSWSNGKIIPTNVGETNLEKITNYFYYKNV